MIIIFLLIDGNRKVARTQPRHAVGLRDRSDGAGTERQEGEHAPPRRAPWQRRPESLRGTDISSREAAIAQAGIDHRRLARQ